MWRGRFLLYRNDRHRLSRRWCWRRCRGGRFWCLRSGSSDRFWRCTWWRRLWRRCFLFRRCLYLGRSVFLLFLLKVGYPVEKRRDIRMGWVELLGPFNLYTRLFEVAFLDELVGDQKALLRGLLVLLYLGSVLSNMFLTGGQRNPDFVMWL